MTYVDVDDDDSMDMAVHTPPAAYTGPKPPLDGTAQPEPEKPKEPEKPPGIMQVLISILMLKYFCMPPKKCLFPIANEREMKVKFSTFK